MAERNPQEQDKYIVRFPAGMRERLKAEAERNNRSLNAELISRLEYSIEDDDTDIERVRLKLPKHIVNSAQIISLAYDQSLDDFVYKAIETSLERHDQFRNSEDEIRSLEYKIKDLEEKLIQIIDTADAWKNVYLERMQRENVFAKLLKMTCDRIVDSGTKVPEDLRTLAIDMKSTLNSELKAMFEQYERTPAEEDKSG